QTLHQSMYPPPVCQQQYQLPRLRPHPQECFWPLLSHRLIESLSCRHFQSCFFPCASGLVVHNSVRVRRKLRDKIPLQPAETRISAILRPSCRLRLSPRSGLALSGHAERLAARRLLTPSGRHPAHDLCEKDFAPCRPLDCPGANLPSQISSATRLPFAFRARHVRMKRHKKKTLMAVNASAPPTMSIQSTFMCGPIVVGRVLSRSTFA